MKLPRDLTGLQLVKNLEVLGYQVARQTGSHIRITTLQSGEHHLTIPAHNPLKTGTLSAILNDIAQHFNLTREELLSRLL
jgi:predicted RNA binding protein YcfA (HicA-like mRNA interferase family)